MGDTDYQPSFENFQGLLRKEFGTDVIDDSVIGDGAFTKESLESLKRDPVFGKLAFYHQTTVKMLLMIGYVCGDENFHPHGVIAGYEVEDNVPKLIADMLKGRMTERKYSSILNDGEVLMVHTGTMMGDNGELERRVFLGETRQIY